MSRIAAYICEYGTYQINVTRSYNIPEFKEDLKTLYAMTGVDSKATAFVFNDTQITVESFLEIINNMLSSGEVANLYKPDEFEDVRCFLKILIIDFYAVSFRFRLRISCPMLHKKQAFCKRAKLCTLF